MSAPKAGHPERSALGGRRRQGRAVEGPRGRSGRLARQGNISLRSRINRTFHGVSRLRSARLPAFTSLGMTRVGVFQQAAKLSPLLPCLTSPGGGVGIPRAGVGIPQVQNGHSASADRAGPSQSRLTCSPDSPGSSPPGRSNPAHHREARCRWVNGVPNPARCRARCGRADAPPAL